MAATAKENDHAKIMRSKSIMKIERMVHNKLIPNSAANAEQKGDDQKEAGAAISNGSSQTKTLSKSPLYKQYKMPLKFEFHRHSYLYIDTPSKDCKELLQFHKEFTKHSTAIFERYGWRPKEQDRLNIDMGCCLIGFAINEENGDVMAQIAFFDVSDSPGKKYGREKEVSITVFPTYQRRHLATDLIHVTWDLFADPEDECWVYVMNSRKSGMFWKAFRQWYPQVNFRLVYP